MLSARLVVFVVICGQLHAEPRYTAGFKGENLTQQQATACLADIGFLLDGSGSVKKENWAAVTNFVNNFAQSLTFGAGGNRFGVTIFGNGGEIALPLQEFPSHDALKEAVNEIRYLDENTNTAAGLRELRRMFSEATPRPGVPRIAVILTDGQATKETEMTSDEARRTRRANMTLFGVGIGVKEELNLDELEEIVGDKRRVYRASEFAILSATVDKVLESACRSIAPVPKDPCFSRDIAIMLDSSGSMGLKNFDMQKTLVKKFLRSIPIGAAKNRVAVGSYSTEAELHIKIGEESDHGRLFEKIDAIPWANQRTNISGALQVLYEEVYNTTNGHRFDHEFLILLFTDGKSNTDSDKVARMAAWLKSQAIRIYVVALGEKTDEAELTSIASFPQFRHKMYIDEKDNEARDLVKFMDMHICRNDIPSHHMPESFKCHSDIVFMLSTAVDIGRGGFNLQKRLVEQTVALLGEYGCRYGILVPGLEEQILQIPAFTNLDSFIKAINELEMSAPKETDLTIDEFVSSLSVAFKGERRIPKLVKGKGGKGRSQRKFGHSASVKWSKEQDKWVSDTGVPQILVYITHGEDLIAADADIQDLKKKIISNFDHLDIMAVGVGQEVPISLLENMVNRDPKSLFIVNVPNLSSLVDHRSLELGLAIAQLASPAVWSCDFEKSSVDGQKAEMCGMDSVAINTANFNWRYGSDETPSLHTGPKKAYNGTYYLYTEATGASPGDQTLLFSPPRNETGDMCLWFHYNMHGWHSGRLEVVVQYQEYPGETFTLWSQYGDQGEDWHLAMTHVGAQPGYRIGLRASRAAGFSGDIAVDALSLTEGPCLAEKTFSPEGMDYTWPMEIRSSSPKRVNKYYGYYGCSQCDSWICFWHCFMYYA